MKKIIFLIFSAITFYSNGQEKIFLTTGDSIMGTIIKIDNDRSRIVKADGTSILILSNLIKKDDNLTESYLDKEVMPKLIIGVHGAPAGALWYGLRSFKKEFGIQYLPRLSFIAGASIQYNLKPRFALCVEANYERKGVYVRMEGVEDSNGNIGTGKQTYQLDYITLPLTTKFRLNKKRVAFYANIGAYMGYLIKYGWKVSFNEIQNLKVNGDLNTMQRIDYGLVTGLGINVPFRNYFKFTMEIKNNLGLHKIINGPSYSNEFAKNETLALLFGIAYKI